MGNDGVSWRGITGRNDLPDLNPSCALFLNFCHRLSITNTILEHKVVQVFTWYHAALGHRSMMTTLLSYHQTWSHMCWTYVLVKKWQSCQLITTSWWVGSTGGENCWTDLGWRGWIGNVWWWPLFVRVSAHTFKIIFHTYQGSLWTWNPKGSCLGTSLWIPGAVAKRSSVPVVAVTRGPTGGCQWWEKPSNWRRRPFGLSCPGVTRNSWHVPTN